MGNLISPHCLMKQLETRQRLKIQRQRKQCPRKLKITSKSEDIRFKDLKKETHALKGNRKLLTF